MDANPPKTITVPPWNEAVRLEEGWFRRTWLVAFEDPPDLAQLSPSPARVEYPDASSHVVAVVIQQDLLHVRLDVYMAYPGDPGGEDRRKLEAETIAYDALLLRRIVGCSSGIATINGFDRHPVLSMALERYGPDPV